MGSVLFRPISTDSWSVARSPFAADAKARYWEKVRGRPWTGPRPDPGSSPGVRLSPSVKPRPITARQSCRNLSDVTSGETCVSVSQRPDGPAGAECSDCASCCSRLGGARPATPLVGAHSRVLVLMRRCERVDKSASTIVNCYPRGRCSALLLLGLKDASPVP
jgi:hypothetical protein